MQLGEIEVRSPDGRRLLAEAAGPEDGPLLIWHGGTPGCRRLPHWWYEEGTKRGLRHLSYSRPGYEGSDRMQGRTVADCAADTVAFADALGAETFYTLGSSGGGPHALACAALLPERVLAAVSVSGVAHPMAPDLDWHSGMARENRDEFEALLCGDEELERYIKRQAEGTRRIGTSEDLRRSIEEGDLHSRPDREAMVGRMLEFGVKAAQLPISTGIWGWFDDEKALWGSDWAFDLESIEVPVSIWQGDTDRMVPASQGEWLARRLPAADFHLLPGEGHISIIEHHYGAILDEMIAAAGD
ncbi:MAG: alpha/beta fold hydrolase [Solirubrobacterales bacterium]